MPSSTDRPLTLPLLSSLLLLACTSGALAQTTEAVQRSSNPGGIRIQGDTTVRGHSERGSAVAAGSGNAASTATGAVRNEVRIQGNTRIDARSQDVNAVAVGKGNKSDNTVGAIGGN